MIYFVVISLMYINVMIYVFIFLGVVYVKVENFVKRFIEFIRFLFLSIFMGKGVLFDDYNLCVFLVRLK